MTKQEFLAMSLPYGVKILWRDDEIVILEPRIIRFIFDNDEYTKPILRPLSDLTKPIEHKGEKFVPIERIKQLLGLVQIGTYFVEDFKFSIKKGALSFNLTMKLIEWHFNLMDKGEEFVDVNTLKENPYK